MYLGEDLHKIPHIHNLEEDGIKSYRSLFEPIGFTTLIILSTMQMW